MVWTYIIIAVLLLAAELLYFKIADRCNIIDKPNERSSHSTIVLRGGGVIFAISMLVWATMMAVQGVQVVQSYLPFLVGLIMICTVSFWDDVHSLSDSLRMVVQILSILLMFWSVGLYTAISPWWLMVLVVVVALFFCVGATNFINFMDGINGITAAYALAMLAPIALVNGSWLKVNGCGFKLRHLHACTCSTSSISRCSTSATGCSMRWSLGLWYPSIGARPGMNLLLCLGER